VVGSSGVSIMKSHDSLFRLVSVASQVFFLCSCVFFFAYTLANPVYNWDTLGYAASVVSLTETDPLVIQQTVYDELRSSVDSNIFYQLTEGFEFRKTVYEDAAAFKQQIPFYKMRVLVLALIALLAKLGVNFFLAQHIVSVCAGTAGLLCLFIVLRSHVVPIFWIFVPWLYYRYTHDLICMSHGGTDMLAFLFAALACVAFLKSSLLIYCLIPFLVLVRTDLILFSFLLLALLAFNDRLNWRFNLIAAIASIMFYLVVNKWAGNYGWQTVVYYVFASDMSATHPLEYSKIGVTLNDYFGYLLEFKGWMSQGASLCIFGCFSVGSYYLLDQFAPGAAAQRSSKEDMLNKLVLLSLASVVYVVIHFLLFPALYMRFFVAQLLVISLTFFALSSYYIRLKFGRAQDFEDRVSSTAH